MKKILFAILLLSAVYLILPTHLQMILKHNYSNVDDYKIFNSNLISPASNPEKWQISNHLNEYKPSPNSLNFFKLRETCAFLVVQNNKIVYELYDENYTDTTISGSFSMAKTVNALLIGKLIEIGKIKSINDDVKLYVPELTNIENRQLKIIDVLTMSADIDWVESYGNPFSLTAESYYGNHLTNLMSKLRIRGNKQSKLWDYQSCCTQILGYIIINVTGKSVAENLKEYLWNPIGAENNALWSTDKNGIEKSFCCLNATARDFARLGQLILQNGKWNDKQVIDSSWIQSMIKPALHLKDDKNRICDWYGYQTWIIDYKNFKIPYFRGILGQFIFVIPELNAVVVRLGKKIERDEDDPHHHNDDIRNYINAGIEVLNK